MRLPFELDPEIIHHIIYSQAGSIGKAIIELIMNSVDAGAKTVTISIEQAGFTCSDNGTGFASKEDVLRYFGRFGTPHVIGDATYGRFRLGRGQIMAFAKTLWTSNYWAMDVDTKKNGYHYDLEESEQSNPGCHIQGTWYEPLSPQEMMTAIQEIRDLVRYTPIEVELNGKVISRNPANEKWTHEDEFAYYRVKDEGGMAIYNQGVLVRNESSHQWGVGGTIVTKKAIGLNVSRTEILRKTCSIWKPIEKQLKALASAHNESKGKHRKTEASREHAARSMLEGSENSLKIYCTEEVITLLPGKNHVTLLQFFQRCYRGHFLLGDGQFTIATCSVIPHGEMIAREQIINVIHYETLARFGCHNVFELLECFERISAIVSEQATTVPEIEEPRGDYYRNAGRHQYSVKYFDFDTLKAAHIEKTMVVTDKNALDKETKRAWTALKHCLHQYAHQCVHQTKKKVAKTQYGTMSILLGQSNVADAWTDGSSYIAINIDIVKKLKGDPLKTISYIFSLIEHEISHEGDSLECGHDLQFFERFHDLNLSMAYTRQQFMGLWLRKYITSLDAVATQQRNKAWREQRLIERAGTGREKKGLNNLVDYAAEQEIMNFIAPEPSVAFIDSINTSLINRGHNKPSIDYKTLITRSDEAVEIKKMNAMFDEAWNMNWEFDYAKQDQEIEPEDEDPEWEAQRQMEYEQEAARINDLMDECASILQMEKREDAFELAVFLEDHNIYDQKYYKKIWEDKPWMLRVKDQVAYAKKYRYSDDMDDDEYVPQEVLDVFNIELGVSRHLMHLVKEGETKWSLERNADIMDFWSNDQYLLWREENEKE
jgi:hypothetical protein